MSELHEDVCRGVPPPPPPPPPHQPAPSPHSSGDAVPPGQRGSQRCGTDYDDANGKCGWACPNNNSEECPHGEDCWSELDFPGACGASTIAARNRCLSAIQQQCELHPHEACSVCQGIDAKGRPVMPPADCQSGLSAQQLHRLISEYCAPQTCEWWQNMHVPGQVMQAYRHFSYAGTCVPHGSSCGDGSAVGSIIAGSTMNNQLPISQPTCPDPMQDCCVLTYPNEQLVYMQGTTLPTPIVKHAKCPVMDTDGVRPPYVHLQDDHRDETSLPGLDATIHAYVVIPCAEEYDSRTNPSGIHKGTAARVTNLRNGNCVDGIVGDCGGYEEGGCKTDGYGEMSYAAVRAIGAYVGPEETSLDPIQIEIGVAADPSACGPASSGH